VPSAAAQALSDTIRATRIEKGFTQESFASEIGLDRSYYGAIERSEYNITIDTLTSIAAGLGVPAWKLLRRAQV
jgi:transcriptional regulator with XRE-family HTH domain